MSRPTSSMREQWREVTNREAIAVLPLLALVVMGVLYGAYFVPGFWAGLSWSAILAVGAALTLGCLIGLARSVGYSPISAPPTASLPSVAAAEANVSARRRRAAVLLELDPAGLGAPTFQRGSAVASTTGYRGQIRSVTPLHASIPDDQ